MLSADLRDKVAENTFDFVLAGEEKDNATHVQCSLFKGDYSDLIGALPKGNHREFGLSIIFCF